MANLDPFEQLDFIQNGRVTHRFHGLRMFDYQRVDAHSYGVAMLTLVLVGGSDAERRERLMLAALVHDLAEHIAGDLPAPTKRTMGPEWRSAFNGYEDGLLAGAGLYVPLNAQDTRVLKLADALEGCLHCIEERRMGNSGVEGIFTEFWKYAYEEQLLGQHPEYSEAGEHLLWGYVQSRWADVCGPSEYISAPSASKEPVTGVDVPNYGAEALAEQAVETSTVPAEGLPDANARQVGGSHYKNAKGIQHWDLVHALGLNYFDAQITRYLCRAHLKNGREDYAKAVHYIDKRNELNLAAYILPDHVDMGRGKFETSIVLFDFVTAHQNMPLVAAEAFYALLRGDIEKARALAYELSQSF
jgi:5'-deoxynucleotidase YfbR-like HD superfamily hydrolase